MVPFQSPPGFGKVLPGQRVPPFHCQPCSTLSQWPPIIAGAFEPIVADVSRSLASIINPFLQGVFSFKVSAGNKNGILTMSTISAPVATSQQGRHVLGVQEIHIARRLPMSCSILTYSCSWLCWGRVLTAISVFLASSQGVSF